LNDGDPSSPILMASGLRLVAWLLVTAVLAGSISAFTTVLRMRRSGLLNDDDDDALPGRRLLDAARPVLLTCTVVSLATASFAAAEVPAIVRALDPASGPLAQIVVWAAFLVLLVLGSVAAKALALSRPLDYFGVVRWVLVPLHVGLRPITGALESLMDRLVPAIWTLDLSPPLGGSEIRGLLADEEASAHLEGEEVDMARSIFELADTEIREIMVPRIDMVALDVQTAFADALTFASKARFTRLPVYEGNPDRILGVVHTKDLLAASVGGESPPLRSLLRPVHYLPESKRIDEALVEFREGRIHLAVVVDEYGGTAGIVTLEDVLEEIVGEIRDEFDQEGELVRLVDPQRAVIDPRVDLDDLNDLLGLTLPTEENDTLGGLLYQLCGKVPVRGDSVDFGDLRFTIDRVERQRIRQVTLESPRPLALTPSNGTSNGGVAR
jgi:putative hemolysin